jgi:hypothetical protein
MNLRRISARAAVVGVSTTLALGALVTGATTAADAASGSGTYNCTTPASPAPVTVTVTIDADLAGLPPLPTGFAAPAGTLTFPVKFVIAQASATAIKSAPVGITKLGVANANLSLPFGDVQIPVTGLDVPLTDIATGADTTLAVAKAAQGAFNLPSPGAAVPVTLPSSFTFNATTNSTIPQAQSLPMTCALTGTSPTLATLSVIKQGSVIGKIKAPKAVKAKKKFTVVVPVTGANVPATGNVVAKEGKKVLGKGAIKNGKATIVVKKGIKKPGKHTIAVSYAGDTKTNPGNTSTVLVKVKPAKKK